MPWTTREKWREVEEEEGEGDLTHSYSTLPGIVFSVALRFGHKTLEGYYAKLDGEGVSLAKVNITQKISRKTFVLVLHGANLRSKFKVHGGMGTGLLNILERDTE